jgi:hypothetical protein
MNTFFLLCLAPIGMARVVSAHLLYLGRLGNFFQSACRWTVVLQGEVPCPQTQGTRWVSSEAQAAL